jgi:proline dehydrogenase
MRALDRALATTLPAVPRPLVRRFADRYMAGETLDEALAVVRRLNGEGIKATLDVLGESVVRREEADATARAYERTLDELAASGLSSGISIKLSALGLEFDPALAERHLASVVRCAERQDRFVRIDMEDSRLTDATLASYRRLREAGHGNVGVVIQAYLRRSLADVQGLADLAPSVRLVKGIYVEPRRIAYRDMAIINRNFTFLLDVLMRQGSYVGIATHDERLVWEALRLVERHGLERDRYEFQLLLGVDEELRDILRDAGHTVRVYVPFGEAWYAYSVRRLRENPSIAGYVFRDVVGGAIRRRSRDGRR